MRSDVPPTITSFAGEIRWDAGGPWLVLEWSTNHAAFCRLDDDDTRYAPQQTGADAIRQAISPAQPLRSSYTLEAVGDAEETAESRTITIRYAIHTTGTTAELDSAVAVHCTPDGERVLVLEASGIAFFDARTMERLPVEPITAPDGTGVDTFALARDGATLYLVSFGGRIYAYDLLTLDLLPGSGAYVAAGSEPPYQIAVSHDHTAIALVTNEAQIDNRTVGTNQLQLLDRKTFTVVHPSPIATEHTLILAVGHRSGRHYLGTADGLRVLEPLTLGEPFAPLGLTFPGMIALSPDEHAVYSVSVDAPSKSFVLSKHDTQSAAPEAQQQIEVGFNPIFMALLGVPFAALIVSPDGRLLFVLGADPVALRRNQLRSTLLVFDTERLEQLAWSPLRFDEAIMPVAVTMSPDGSRIFIIAGERIGSTDSTSFLFRADAAFA